jgi:regulatory protein
MSTSSIPATDALELTLPGLVGALDEARASDGVTSEERKACMERAGRLLATRARSERELRDRLSAAAFEAATVDATIERLRELRLVDDHDFARQWAEERSARKGIGPVKLKAELVSKGVEAGVVDEVLGGLDLDEEAAATGVAASLVRKVARKPLQAQAASLWQMLRRKGYSSEACEAAVKAVMPPEGWD